MADRFVDRLQARVAACGPDRFFTFVEEGRQPLRFRRSHAEIDAGARARAGLIADRAEPGQPVLLLYPEGLEFLQTFLGCLYAGRPAVPAPVPHDGRSLERVSRIIGDAGIRLVLTVERFAAAIRGAFEEYGPAGEMECLATDGTERPEPGAWRAAPPDGDQVAVVQYTSGSTSEPKGVLIRHRHLLRNAEAIGRAFELGDHEATVSWLPHYHDMGLMGMLLQPLYAGADTTLISPLTFLKRPHRWLELVSSERATVIAAPDFAYELCTRRVTDEQLARLDLTSLRIAMNGAEPVRAGTLREFSRRFAPAGFRPEAFTPCYGMAETTLFATAAAPGLRYREAAVDPAALERNEVRPAADGLALVSSGRPVGVEVLVVEPETGEALADERVGEIWLRGDHVADGYWETARTRPAGASARVFDAHAADGRGPYLRTGDLGFLSDGELFVTGRLKEVVIVNGRNIYPQDIEQAVRAVHPALISSVSAAFAGPAGAGGEQVVVIQEVVPARVEVSMPELAGLIRSSLARSFGIPAPTVALVHRGVIKRTTSGKIRRRAMRDAFTAGGLQPIHLEPSR